jgi:hypothetical protein
MSGYGTLAIIGLLGALALGQGTVPGGGNASSGPAPERREICREGRQITATFHLGKKFCPDLAPFPADEKKFLVVELCVENRGQSPVSLYLEQVWLHLDEENQRVSFSRAEEAGPAVYRSPMQVLPPDEADADSRVQVYNPGPVYQDGQVLVNPTGGGGVMVDLGRKKNAPPPISLDKFVLTLFKKEFTATFLKPAQSASGFLYFLLPWKFDSLSGMQLHLDDLFGNPEELVLSLPPAPPTNALPSPPR